MCGIVGDMPKVSKQRSLLVAGFVTGAGILSMCAVKTTTYVGLVTYAVLQSLFVGKFFKYVYSHWYWCIVNSKLPTILGDTYVVIDNLILAHVSSMCTLIEIDVYCPMIITPSKAHRIIVLVIWLFVYLYHDKCMHCWSIAAFKSMWCPYATLDKISMWALDPPSCKH